MFFAAAKQRLAGPARTGTQFGIHIVRIFNPQAFIREFFAAVCRMEIGGRGVLTVDCCRVRYDKDAVSALPDDIDTQNRLTYGQKPDSFAGEREFRLAVLLDGGPNGAPEHLELRLARVAEFARLIDAP